MFHFPIYTVGPIRGFFYIRYNDGDKKRECLN